METTGRWHYEIRANWRLSNPGSEKQVALTTEFQVGVKQPIKEIGQNMICYADSSDNNEWMAIVGVHRQFSYINRRFLFTSHGWNKKNWHGWCSVGSAGTQVTGILIVLSEFASLEEMLPEFEFFSFEGMSPEVDFVSFERLSEFLWTFPSWLV